MLGALNQPFPSGHDGGFEDSKRAEPEINAARPLAADNERSAAVPSGGASERSAAGPVPGFLAIAVCGAHMSGLPLNHQLRERGAYLLEATRTAKSYRLYALPGGPPQRPGLIRVTRGGSAIAVEVWAMPTEHLGSFLAGVPAPLGLGTVDLETGRALGFICEGYAGEDATDVTAHGGWRAYLDSQKA
jgi:allophanate hydrolase